MKIIIEHADNGIIKTIIDNNINGAGGKLKKQILYQNTSNSLELTKNFINDLIRDLGLEIGNDYSKNVLVIRNDFGKKYNMTEQDYLSRKKVLKSELNIINKQLNEYSDSNGLDFNYKEEEKKSIETNVNL